MRSCLPAALEGIVVDTWIWKPVQVPFSENCASYPDARTKNLLEALWIKKHMGYTKEEAGWVRSGPLGTVVNGCLHAA